MVTNRFPCTISLLLPPYSEVGSPGYKCIALHPLPAITALHRGWVQRLQMDCLVPFPCCPRPTPGLVAMVTNGLSCTFSLLSSLYSRFGVVVTNGLPCTFSLLSLFYTRFGVVVTNGLSCAFSLPYPPYSVIRGSGYKWNVLHRLPDITALTWLQMDCLAPFSYYPRPTSGLGGVVANGLPCTFSLLTTPYSGVEGRGYKWIALHLFPTIPALLRGWGPWLQMDCPAHFPCYPRPTPGLGAVVANGLPCTFFLISPPYSGVGGRGYKWITLQIFPTNHALPRICGCGYKWILLHIFPAIPALLRGSGQLLQMDCPVPFLTALPQGWGPWSQMDCLAPFPCYPGPTPELHLFQAIPAHFHDWGRGYKWNVLHIFPAIPALSRGWSHGYKWNVIYLFPASLQSPPYADVGGRGYKRIALHILPDNTFLPGGWESWLQMDCLAPFACYPRPTPGLGAVVTNGLPCIFSFLSPPYSVVTNGMPCTFSLLSRPYPGVEGRSYKWIVLHIFHTIPALRRGWGP